MREIQFRTAGLIDGEAGTLQPPFGQPFTQVSDALRKAVSNAFPDRIGQPSKPGPDFSQKLEKILSQAPGFVEQSFGAPLLTRKLPALGRDIAEQSPDTEAVAFQELEQFLVDCLGRGVTQHYQIIVGSSEEVGRSIRKAVENVHAHRRSSQQAYYFNWELQIPPELQEPFVPTHDEMASLQLRAKRPGHQLASALRCAFSGLVAGNVKAFGIEQVRAHGPYKLSGDANLLSSMDRLLQMLVREQRMKLGEGERDYQPCYQLAD